MQRAEESKRFQKTTVLIAVGAVYLRLLLLQQGPRSLERNSFGTRTVIATNKAQIEVLVRAPRKNLVAFDITEFRCVI